MKAKINRSVSALFLALFLLFGAVAPAFAAETAKASGTEEQSDGAVSASGAASEEALETISIRSADDLLALADSCSLDTWSVGKLVVLEADIALNGASFLTIPSFGGVFDGNGHTISGLQIDESITPAGLFGELQAGGIVRDLNVSGTVAPAGDARFVGGIVGENYGTISNCTFTGSAAGSANVGGIAGANTTTGKIVGCEASGSVTGTDMTGGIVGCNLGLIGNCVNNAYVNTVSTDPTIRLEDIDFDFLTDVSKLSSLDTSSAAMDTGGIAGYSSGILESCTNRAAVGYPHIGYNVGGVAGRSCGYLYACENAAEVYGRKDVGGIVGQMEPYIAQNLTESSLAKLERQLDELDALLSRAIGHADGAADSVARRLNAIAGSMDAAGAAAQDIRTNGAIAGSVAGSGEAGGSGSVTITPPQVQAGGSGGAGGSIGVEISPGSGSVDIQTGSGGEIHAGLTEGGVAGSGQTSGSGSLDAQTQISISTNLAGLSSAIYGMAGQMSLLSGEISGASGELYADVQSIREKVGEITDTAFEMFLGEGEGDVIIDSSETDIDLVTLGKAAECANGGSVSGDINVGGIAGAMAMEYTLDPEDDVTIHIDGSERRKYEVKAIVHKCKNTGAVTAKRNYTGGIAGKMDLGLIAQCESYGTVSSESGSYVGGIAGLCGSTIRHCFIKCSLSGSKYIGGVVGCGVEEDRNGESSTVAACYAIVAITDYTQYAGAIAGDYAGVFMENYFVSEDLAGINRMSYSGAAEPVSYDELIRMFASEEAGADTAGSGDEAGKASQTVSAAAAVKLPDEFKKFTLQFVVDGTVVRTETFDYGASFGEDVFPSIPAKDGYYGYWDKTDLENLKFDTTVTAVYEPYMTALQSTDTRSEDKSIFYVEGLFGEGDCLTAEPLALTPDEFNQPDGIWDALRQSFSGLRLNTNVVEQWELQIPADGQETHTIRYLPPDGSAEDLDVYVRQDGRWVKAETEAVGSYVTFPAAGETVTVAVMSGISAWWVWLIAAVLALILILLVLRLIRKLRSRKPKAVHAAERAPAAERIPVPQRGEPDRENPAGELPADPPPSPAAPKKKKRWLIPLLVILLLLVAGGAAVCFLLPGLAPGAAAYELLKAYAETEEASMSLQAEAVVGEQSFPIDALLDRVSLDGQSVTVVSEGGRALYYSNGAVFLENGAAYQISDACPDYSGLLEQTMALYQHVEIEAVDNTYSILAEGADAEAILKLLIPSAASLLSETNSLNVDLIEQEGVLEQIRFSGSGRLNDRNATAFSVSAVLTCSESPRGTVLPQAVAQAIQTGASETTAVLSDDLLRLINGWQDLNARSPLYAQLTLSADCGPLVLSSRLDVYRWNTEDAPIFSIQENGYALYFMEDTLCDANGNAVSAAGGSHPDAARLLDLAYAFCMNAGADCKAYGSRYVYTVSLDEEGMKQVASAIAPEAEKLDVSFAAGNLVVSVSDGKIESIEASVSGSVQVALTSADAAMGAKLEFAETDAQAAVPEAVLEALQN